MNLPTNPATRGFCPPTHAAQVVRIDADASWHPDGISTGPVSVLVDNSSPRSLRILAHAPPQEVDHHPAAATARRIDAAGHVLIPGLVNAHTHLDLTHLGPHPWDHARPFTDWVAIIRAGRHTEARDIAQSVAQGATLAIAGGTAIVGDICGAVRAQASPHAALALDQTGLRGVSFLEFFAIGPRAAANVVALSEFLDAHRPAVGPRVRVGLQPHATNTVDPEAYLASVDFAVQWDLPLSTHLAESQEERQFIAAATGPQRQLLESVGAWDDSLTRVFGQGKHPVAHLHPALKEARTAYRPFLAAHVNDATDEAIAILAATRTNVAYCPRASAYFGAHHHFGPHRYQDMLAAGVNVCLGTDSIVNITDGTASHPHVPRLSILDEIRFLHARDTTNPLTLIQMATIHGTRALSMGSQHVRLTNDQSPLAILGVPTARGNEPDRRAFGSEAVQRALAADTAPVSILTRIVPV